MNLTEQRPKWASVTRGTADVDLGIVPRWRGLYEPHRLVSVPEKRRASLAILPRSVAFTKQSAMVQPQSALLPLPTDPPGVERPKVIAREGLLWIAPSRKRFGVIPLGRSTLNALPPEFLVHRCAPTCTSKAFLAHSETNEALAWYSTPIVPKAFNFIKKSEPVYRWASVEYRPLHLNLVQPGEKKVLDALGNDCR